MEKKYRVSFYDPLREERRILEVDEWGLYRLRLWEKEGIISDLRNRSKKCPRCGALNNPELNNCFNCGTDIKDIEAKQHKTGRLEPEQY